MEREAEYISDGNHNYLRINCGEERKSNYSYKMITENAIKGLLPCRIRVVNGNTYLYYEVQSRQTLFYRYEVKEMDYDALKNIFFHLCLLGDELEKYFLDFNDIFFDEQYIFQDIETGETVFLFLPDEKPEENHFASFTEYIVKRINHKDAKAVQAAYRLYDLSRQDHIMIQEIRQLFEEEEKIVFQTEKAEYDTEWKQEEKPTKQPDEEQEEWEWMISEEKQEIKKAKWSDIYIPAFLCIMLTVLICIKLSFKLSYGEETIWIAGLIVNIGLCVSYFVYRIWEKGRKKRETEESCKGSNSVQRIYEEANINIQKCGKEQEWNDIQAEKEDVYGETVFLEPEPENILCGLGKFEKLTVKLEHFPFSIGKLKEEADYVLKDNSVSRLHARFYRENKSIYLVDLNSTNGTYKNGFRIPANEKILLEEGDEIIFGKVRFCYR